MAALHLAFEERMRRLIGSGYDAFYSEITAGKPTKGMFLNENITENDILAYYTKKIPFYEEGYYFDGDGIGNSPL